MEDFAPGFRFYPTEEELILFYLHNKLQGKRKDLNRAINRVIPVLYIYAFNPWDLPQLSGELSRQEHEEWFFFIPRDEKEIKGGKPNRLTDTGFWKSAGSISYVYSSNNRCIGTKRTMAFYKGRVPNGRKTEWKMNEYKAIVSSSSSTAYPMVRQEFSLCRVYKTSKYRRSFDRRLVGEAIPQVSVEELANQDEESPLMVDNTIYTHETSTSVTPTAMPIDSEPLWDWEHLYMQLGL